MNAKVYRKDVLILIASDGYEWFFIEGELVDEGSPLGEGRSRTYLLEASEKYGFISSDVRTEYLCEEDDEYAQTYGQLDWDNLKGDYGIKLSGS